MPPIKECIKAGGSPRNTGGGISASAPGTRPRNALRPKECIKAGDGAPPEYRGRDFCFRPRNSGGGLNAFPDRDTP